MEILNSKNWMRLVVIVATIAAVILAAIVVGPVVWSFLASLIKALAGVLGPLIWAALLAYLLHPAVDMLDKRGVPRVLAILILYILIIGTIVMLFVFVVPKVVAEFDSLATQFPTFIEQGQKLFTYYMDKFNSLQMPASIRQTVQENIGRLQNGVLSMVTGTAEWLIGLFGKLFNAVIVPVLAFYLLKDSRKVTAFLLGIIPVKARPQVLQLLRRVDSVLGAWVRGQLIVSSVVFFFTFLGLYIVGMDFALILGIFSGITNIIPYFGPIIGAIPGAFFALLQGPRTLVLALIVYFVVQQVESSVISPQIMGQQIGLPPVVIIIALLLGGQLGGTLGMIFAVPVAAIIKVTILYIADLRSSVA